MCTLNWTVKRGLLALTLAWTLTTGVARAQAPEISMPATGSTAEDLTAVRRAWVESLNRQAGLGAPLRYVGQQPAMCLRTFDRIQLTTEQPSYVPYQVVPPGSNLAGLFSQYQYGGSSLQMGGDSHIMIHPNDPWNGWGRRGVSMLGTVLPGTGLFPNYWLLPGHSGGSGVW